MAFDVVAAVDVLEDLISKVLGHAKEIAKIYDANKRWDEWSANSQHDYLEIALDDEDYDSLDQPSKDYVCRLLMERTRVQ